MVGNDLLGEEEHAFPQRDTASPGMRGVCTLGSVSAVPDCRAVLEAPLSIAVNLSEEDSVVVCAHEAVPEVEIPHVFSRLS